MARNIPRRRSRHSRNKAGPAKPATRGRAIKSAKKPPVGARRGDAAAPQAKVIETLVAASAQALALPVEPAWRAGVKRNLQVILEHAALVDQFSLPDDIEPAPVFRA